MKIIDAVDRFFVGVILALIAGGCLFFVYLMIVYANFVIISFGA